MALAHIILTKHYFSGWPTNGSSEWIMVISLVCFRKAFDLNQSWNRNQETSMLWCWGQCITVVFIVLQGQKTESLHRIITVWRLTNAQWSATRILSGPFPFLTLCKWHSLWQLTNLHSFVCWWYHSALLFTICHWTQYYSSKGHKCIVFLGYLKQNGNSPAKIKNHDSWFTTQTWRNWIVPKCQNKW